MALRAQLQQLCILARPGGGSPAEPVVKLGTGPTPPGKSLPPETPDRHFMEAPGAYLGSTFPLAIYAEAPFSALFSISRTGVFPPQSGQFLVFKNGGFLQPSRIHVALRYPPAQSPLTDY